MLGKSFVQFKFGRLKLRFVRRNFDDLYKITEYKEQTCS